MDDGGPRPLSGAIQPDQAPAGPGISVFLGADGELLYVERDPAAGNFPARLTRSAPDLFEVPVADPLRPALHNVLSGVRDRLLRAAIGDFRRPGIRSAAAEAALGRRAHRWLD